MPNNDSNHTDLEKILMNLSNRLQACDLCPNQCGCNRLLGQTGLCHNTNQPAIYQHFLHTGEEISLVPAFIINLSGCSLACPTCSESCRFGKNLLPIHNAENYAEAMVRYFKHHGMPKSIEWIGGEPSTQLHFVLEVSWHLKKLSFHEPIFFNTNAYFDVALLDLMHNIIDGFVFDLKCTNSCQNITGGFTQYYETATRVITQAVNDFNNNHILRHLVMPGHVDCCTRPIIEWCRTHIPSVTFNLMTTFHDFRPNADFFELPNCDAVKSIEIAKSAGFSNLMINGNYIK